VKKAYLYIGIAAYTKVVGSIIITAIFRKSEDEPSELTKHYLKEYGLEEATKYIQDLVDIEYNQYIIPSFVLSSNKVMDILPKKVQLLIYTTLNFNECHIDNVDIHISDYVFIPGLIAHMPSYNNEWCDVAICLGLKIYQIELEELKSNLPNYNLDISNGDRTLMQCLYILLSKKPFALRAMDEIDYQHIIQFVAVTEFWFVIKRLLRTGREIKTNFIHASSVKDQSPFPVNDSILISEKVTKSSVRSRSNVNYLIYTQHEVLENNKEKISLIFNAYWYVHTKCKKERCKPTKEIFHYINIFSFFTTLFFDLLKKSNDNLEMIYNTLLFSEEEDKRRSPIYKVMFKTVLKEMEEGNIECLPNLIDYTYLKKV